VFDYSARDPRRRCRKLGREGDEHRWRNLERDCLLYGANGKREEEALTEVEGASGRTRPGGARSSRHQARRNSEKRFGTAR